MLSNLHNWAYLQMDFFTVVILTGKKKIQPASGGLFNQKPMYK